MRLRRTLLAAAVLAAAHAPASAQERPYLLEGLVVTASPTPRAAGDVARSVTVLEGDELRARGVSLVSEALREVPGLAVVRGGSFGATTSVFLRGGESDYVQVLVDGVQVNSPGGAFDFAGLTLDNVERIEIVRGPASSLYGSDAMAGVIHVITRTGRAATRGELSARMGSFGRREGALSLSGGAEAVAWSLGLTRIRMDGLLPVNNGFENTVLTGTVRLTPDAATRAAVSVRLADRAYHFPTDGSGAVTDSNAFTFGDETSVSVTATRVLGSGWELRGSVGLAESDGGTDDQADAPGDSLGFFGFTSLDHVRRATADLRAHWVRGTTVATLGLEVEAQDQRSFSESLSQWGADVGRSEYGRDNRAGYAHVTGASGDVAYGLGGRLEDNGQFGRFATWNAELAWRAAPGVRLRAAAGTGIKEPTFYENFAQGWVRGNPDLDPERARSLETGVEAELPGGWGTLRAAAFTQRFSDLIEYVSAPADPAGPNYVNVAEASARGLELGATVRFGAARAGASWSVLDTEVLDAGSDDAGADFVPGARLLRRPTHAVHADLVVPVSRATVTADVRVVGAREDRDFSTWPAARVELGPYTVVGLSAEAPVGERLRVSVRADNLLDARYEEVVGFPAPGRGIQLGGALTLGGR